MRGYPQFSFWISIAPDMIYLSHMVIIWEKILPISGHRPYVFGLASGTVSSSCPLARKDREHLRWLRRLEI